MLHEKPDDSFHWKNNLDELDHVPGEMQPDKARAWDMLHNRLRANHDRRAFPWYWIAAAALVSVFGFTWMLQGSEKHDVVKKKEPGIQNVRPDVPGFVKTNDSSFDNTAKKQKTTIDVPVDKIMIRKEQVHKASQHSMTMIVVDSTIQQAPEVIAHIIPVEDTGVVAAITPVKKKLRIIHINDLDKSLPQIEYARTPSSSQLPPRLSRRDGVSAFMLGGNASDNIIKIKLSPSN